MRDTLRECAAMGGKRCTECGTTFDAFLDPDEIEPLRDVESEPSWRTAQWMVMLFAHKFGAAPFGLRAVEIEQEGVSYRIPMGVKLRRIARGLARAGLVVVDDAGVKLTNEGIRRVALWIARFQCAACWTRVMDAFGTSGERGGLV
jgi:hypothetical protein